MAVEAASADMSLDVSTLLCGEPGESTGLARVRILLGGWGRRQRFCLGRPSLKHVAPRGDAVVLGLTWIRLAVAMAQDQEFKLQNAARRYSMLRKVQYSDTYPYPRLTVPSYPGVPYRRLWSHIGPKELTKTPRQVRCIQKNRWSCPENLKFDCKQTRLICM